MATQKIDFHVKDKSAETFFKQHAILSVHQKHDMERGGIINPYNLLKDRLLLKKECGIGPDQTVAFDLVNDRNETGRKLIYKYLYAAKEYDSVSLELTLIDFKVDVGDNVIYPELSGY